MMCRKQSESISLLYIYYSTYGNIPWLFGKRFLKLNSWLGSNKIVARRECANYQSRLSQVGFELAVSTAAVGYSICLSFERVKASA